MTRVVPFGWNSVCRC